MSARLHTMTRRCRAGLLAGLSLVTLTSTAYADDRSFIGPDDEMFWSTAANWTPNGAPGLVNNAVWNAYVGQSAPAINHTVMLDLHVPYLFDLELTDGMTLDTNGYFLEVSGHTTISDENIDGFAFQSDLHVRPRIGGGLSARLWGASLINRGRMRLIDDPQMEMIGTLTVNKHSILWGNGTIEFTEQFNQPLVVNDGHLGSLEGPLTFVADSNGTWDFDGPDGDGRLITYEDADFTVQGGTVDLFEGKLHVTQGATMTLDVPGVTFIEGNSDEPTQVLFTGYDSDLATLAGGPLTFAGGDIRAINHARIENDLVIHDGTFIEVASSILHVAEMTWAGTNTIVGGEFLIEDGALLDLAGPTTVTQAEFELENGTLRGGAIRNDDVAGMRGSGVIENQIDNRSFIAADELVLQCTGANSNWDGDTETGSLYASGGDLHLVDTLDQSFRSNLAVGVDRELVVDGFSFTFEQPSLIQLFDGTLRATEPQTFEGTIESTGVSNIDADATFAGGSSTIAHSILRLHGDVDVENGALWNGVGPLVALGTSSLTLEDGATLPIELYSHGTFRPDAGIGDVTIDADFENVGTMAFQIAGTTEDQYDQITVNGTMTMRGVVSVELLGDVPPSGTIFEVLDADTFVDLGYTFDLPDLPGNLYWETQFFGSNGWLIVAETCTGDLDHNGDIGFGDLIIVLVEWGPCDACDADINENGSVDFSDLLFILSNWGPCG